MQRLAAKAAIFLLNVLVYARWAAWIWTFHETLGYWPNVCYPQTRNEKFLWRKIFDRNPMYRLVADKLTVRQFIKMRCPDLPMSEIVWIGASPELIPEALLQRGFVIKTNNGSSRNIFIGNGPLDRDQINRQVTEWLTHPYTHEFVDEWAYAKIQPYVFVERLVTVAEDPQFLDISCHVVMGKCMLVTIEKDAKKASERVAIFDVKANRLPIDFKAQELPENFSVPATFEKAIKLAESIARDFDYIRVDFMSTGNQLYFCECTVFPMRGLSVINVEADSRIAAAWDLRNSWFMQRPQQGVSRLYRKLYRHFLNVVTAKNLAGSVNSDLSNEQHRAVVHERKA
jgi:hypothetical protein